MAIDPYAAPKSRVADTPHDSPQSVFVPGGRSVVAGNGWNWITDAWEMFKSQKGTWIGVFVIFAILVVASNILPGIGPILLVLFTPVLYGGVMLGCEAQRRGSRLEISHLFAGFRNNTGKLVGVGAASLLLFAGVFVVIMLIFGTEMASMMVGKKPTPEQMQAAAMSSMLAPLLILALSLPIYMAIWFATPLVVFNNLGVGEAMKGSFSGCLRNIVPFLVFGVAVLLLAIVATIPIGLGWLVLGPVLLASIHTGYRDIYYEH